MIEGALVFAAVTVRKKRGSQNKHGCGIVIVGGLSGELKQIPAGWVGRN